MNSSARSRFEDKVSPEPNTGCWIWDAATSRNGFGAFRIGGRTDLAHRASYRIYVGEIPPGMRVIMSCGNVWCVAPEHLLLAGKDRRSRFMYRVSVSRGCWTWNGAKDSNGYGRVSRATYGESCAHRASYRMFVGPIPDGLGILHACDNPPCVNPEHLRPGTQADNVADMMERGRHATQKEDG